jgi:hypothetical protein
MTDFRRQVETQWTKQAVANGMLKTTSPFTDFRLPDEPLLADGLACASHPPKGSAE